MASFHKWGDWNTGTKFSDKLPPGRWLRRGEEIRKTDLVCYSDKKAIRIGDDNYWVGQRFKHSGDKTVTVSRFIYRPASRPKYRYLKEGEIIKKNDQFKTANGRWTLTCCVGQEVHENFVGSYRRRKHVRTR